MMKSYFKILFLTVFITASGCARVGDSLANDLMHFSYEVVDEKGKAIPYVFVLGSEEPKDGRNDVDLQLNDLKYFIEKFTKNQTFIVTGSTPVNTVIAHPSTNEFGKGVYSVNYGDLYWRGVKTNLQRFVFIKRGYEPYFLEYKYKKGAHNVLFKIALKKKKTRKIFSPLLVEFDKLRYQIENYKFKIHDSSHSTNIEIEKVTQELINLGGKAKAIEEHTLAAMIFFYASSSPSVIRKFENGISVKGYSRGGNSPQSQKLKELALDINRVEPNMLLMKLHNDYAEGINVSVVEPLLLTDYLKKLEAILLPKKEEVRPSFHRHYILKLRRGKRFKKACQHAIWFDDYYRNMSENTRGSTAVEMVNNGLELDKKLELLPQSETFKCEKS